MIWVWVWFDYLLRHPCTAAPMHPCTVQAAPVYVMDGVLFGAGDFAYAGTAMVAAAAGSAVIMRVMVLPVVAHATTQLATASHAMAVVWLYGFGGLLFTRLLSLTSRLLVSSGGPLR